MKVAGRMRIVLVTCGTLTEGRRIAKKVVEKRLAACVNVMLGPVESVYRWKGKVEKAREVLLLMKTSAKRLGELEKEVKRLHSYDVPEFIAVPIVEGEEKYLAWLEESVGQTAVRGGERMARKKRKSTD